MTTLALPPLIVDLAEVARRAGLDYTDLDVAQVVEDAVRDATTDVESYLGYPVTPTPVVEAGLVPGRDGSWELAQDPVLEVTRVTAELDDELEPTDRYTVEYLVGIDARLPEFRPIVRWVTAAAVYAHPGVRALVVSAGQRIVRSVSAEGQSVTYESPPPTGGAPTAGVPALSTLDRWRLAGRRAYTAPGWTDPAPY